MNSTVESDMPRSNLRLIAIAPLFALIALVCWAFASPIGSSPDDDFHLASIWCGLGNRPDTCEPVAGHAHEFKVPKSVADANKCFAGNPEQSAGCQSSALGAEGLLTTDRGNFDGLYPPVYYSFMGLFVGPNVVVSALAMRIVNCALFIGLTCALYFLLPRRRHDTLLYAWAIGIVPLGMFLLASNNPSAWAIISGGTLWLALVGYFETAGSKKVGLGVLAGASAIVGAGARADAALYSVIAIGISVLLTARRSRAYWLSAIFPAALVIIAASFYVSANQSGVASSGFNSGDAPIGKLTLAWQNFIQLPSLWSGSFGTWPLGWLDTTMPAIVSISAIAAFAATLFVGFSAMNVRKLIALAGLSVLLFAIPFWLLLASNAVVGQAIQPRYLLPLILMLAGVALFQPNGRGFSLTPYQSTVVAIALSAANSIALHVNIQRYTTGLDVNGFNLNHSIEWWWSGIASPMAVWAIGSLAFAAAVSLALLHASIISAEGVASRKTSLYAPGGTLSRWV